MIKFFTLLLIVLITQLIALPAFAGKCTGSSNCRACSSCSSCKHCARNGGTCGVCSGDLGSNSKESYGFPGKALALGAGAVGVAYFVGKRNNDKKNL